MRIVQQLLLLRLKCAALALFGAFIGIVGRQVTIRHLGAAYVGLDALFTFVAVATYWRTGPRFIALYVAVTATWFVVAFWLITQLT